MVCEVDKVSLVVYFFVVIAVWNPTLYLLRGFIYSFDHPWEFWNVRIAYISGVMQLYMSFVIETSKILLVCIICEDLRVNVGLDLGFPGLHPQ